MCPQGENPGAGGAGAFGVCSAGQRNTLKIARKSAALVVTWLPNQDPVRITGREAQTLYALYRAGDRGLTSGEFSARGWARRTSAYVHMLRKTGLDISTTREVVPPDANVGRYRLHSHLVVRARFGLD